MVLVVMSGIVGQALHYRAFRMLYERRHQLDFEGMTEDAIEARLHDLALQEEALRWWRCLHGPLTWSFVALVLLHIGGALFFRGL
jgi:cytochrome b561